MNVLTHVLYTLVVATSFYTVKADDFAAALGQDASVAPAPSEQPAPPPTPAPAPDISTPPPALDGSTPTPPPDGSTSPQQPPADTAAFSGALQQSSTPTEGAVAPSEPVAKSERMQGPDTIDLVENKPNLITNSASNIPDIFKQIDAPLASITKTVGDLIKLREDAYKQYFELDATIDEALQSSGFDKGNVEALTKPVSSSPAKG